KSPEPSLSDLTLVLPHDAHQIARAVHSESVAGEVLGGEKRALALSRWSDHGEQAAAGEAPEPAFDANSALGNAELVVHATRDREVPLVRIERTFDHPDPFDHLWDDEVRVGVAMAIRVVPLVDRHPVDGEFDVLPLLCVEAAKKDLIGVA